MNYKEALTNPITEKELRDAAEFFKDYTKGGCETHGYGVLLTRYYILAAKALEEKANNIEEELGGLINENTK